MKKTYREEEEDDTDDEGAKEEDENEGSGADENGWKATAVMRSLWGKSTRVLST